MLFLVHPFQGVLQVIWLTLRRRLGNYLDLAPSGSHGEEAAGIWVLVHGS